MSSSMYCARLFLVCTDLYSICAFVNGVDVGGKATSTLLALVVLYSRNYNVRYDNSLNLGPFYITKCQFSYPFVLPLLGMLYRGKPGMETIAGIGHSIPKES